MVSQTQPHSSPSTTNHSRVSSSNVPLKVATAGPPVTAYYPSPRRHSSSQSRAPSVVSALRTKHRFCLGLVGDSSSRSRLISKRRL
ncbi:hypothetical protein U1Q18_015932 [Sarracenia purpurea var. burkii]